MYKICIHCLSKGIVDVLKVSRCMHLVFGSFWCYLAVVRVDLAFFANDYLATPLVAASYCDCYLTDAWSA